MADKIYVVSCDAGIECSLYEDSARRLYKQWEKSFYAKERDNLKLYEVDLVNGTNHEIFCSNKYNAIKPILYNTLHDRVICMCDYDIKELKAGISLHCRLYSKDKDSVEHKLAFATLNKCLSVFHKEHPDIKIRVRVDNELYKIIEPE